MKIYIVSETGWEGGFDSAWSTEDLAQDRADVLDPYPDKDGVRWGLVLAVELDADPDAEDYGDAIDRRPT